MLRTVQQRADAHSIAVFVMNRHQLAQSLVWRSGLGLNDTRSESLALFTLTKEVKRPVQFFSQSVRCDPIHFRGHNSISCNLGKTCVFNRCYETRSDSFGFRLEYGARIASIERYK